MAKEKILFIVRHAKSSWDIENLSDIDRPLKLRGIRDAYEMARRMKINRIIPEFFISSHAIRALHTATIFHTVFEEEYLNFKIDHKLYGQGKEAILEVLHLQPNELKRLIIFGHNPDFSQLVREFAQQPFFELPTCGLVMFKFATDSWSEISKSNVKSEFFDFPKNDE